MAKLDGKIVFIPGGAGNVGEGLVRSFLKAGAIVITSSRKQQSLDQLRSDLGALALEHELVAMEIPKEDIVLGFQAPYMREHTGFGVA